MKRIIASIFMALALIVPAATVNETPADARGNSVACDPGFQRVPHSGWFGYPCVRAYYPNGRIR